MTLTASLLGYADSEGGVLVGGGQTLEVEVRLSPEPIACILIVVEATRLEVNGMMADVRRRAETGWGTVLMEEELYLSADARQPGPRTSCTNTAPMSYPMARS